MLCTGKPLCIKLNITITLNNYLRMVNFIENGNSCNFHRMSANVKHLYVTTFVFWQMKCRQRQTNVGWCDVRLPVVGAHGEKRWGCEITEVLFPCSSAAVLPVDRRCLWHHCRRRHRHDRSNEGLRTDLHRDYQHHPRWRKHADVQL